MIKTFEAIFGSCSRRKSSNHMEKVELKQLFHGNC